MDRPRLTTGQWLLRQALTIQTGGRLVAWAALSAVLPRRLGQRFSGPSRLRCGLILVLPGIEGEGFLNHDIATGLHEANVPDAIEIFDWTRGRHLMFHNLMGLQRNRQQAALLAQRIRDYQQQHPGRPIHLVAHSGGTGIATMALEQLDAKCPITSVIMLASALSPEYNLAPALKRTTCGIYSLHSPHDFFYLGLGTRTFGTIDRKLRLAAGKVGFTVPHDCDPFDAGLYRTKLHQVAWRPEWLHWRHGGGHLGWADRRFCRDWLSRIILGHHNGQPINPCSQSWS